MKVSTLVGVLATVMMASNGGDLQAKDINIKNNSNESIRVDLKAKGDKSSFGADFTLDAGKDQNGNIAEDTSKLSITIKRNGTSGNKDFILDGLVKQAGLQLRWDGENLLAVLKSKN